MTTYLAVSPYQYTNYTDASFRDWGNHFSTQVLAGVGLVKSTEAGQIDWTTATRPAINVNAGYELWSLNDSYDSVNPIVFRFDYGTNDSTSEARITVTVISGGRSATSGDVLEGYAANVGTPTIMACRTEGAFWFAVTNQTGTYGSMFFQRRLDQNTGLPVPSGDHFMVNTVASSSTTFFSTFNCWSTGSGGIVRTGTLNDAVNMLWEGSSSGYSGGDAGVGQVYAAYPEICVQDVFACYRSGELTSSTTHTLTSFGTNKTYFATGQKLGSSGLSTDRIAGIWQ